MSLDEYTNNLDKIQKVRFIISGEPFDILWSILNDPELKNTLLFRSAEFSVHAGKFDNIDKSIVLVEMSRDIRSFRIIKHFIETNNAIIPLDPIDRELVWNEAMYFGITNLANILMSNRPVQNKLINQERKDNKNDLKKLESKESENNNQIYSSYIIDSDYIKPSERIIRKLFPMYEERKTIESDEDQSFWNFWKIGLVDDLEEIDQKIRTEELLIRKELFSNPNICPNIPSIDLFSNNLDLKLDDNIPDYSFVSYPGYKNIPKNAIPLVNSFKDFQNNFDAFTLGTIKNLVIDLPLIVAGGSILTCLHKWEPEISISKLMEMSKTYFINNANSNSLQLFIDFCINKNIQYESRYRRRWYNNTTEDTLRDEIAVLKKRLDQLTNPSKNNDNDNENILQYELGMLARMSGIKLDKYGNIRTMSYKEECILSSEETHSNILIDENKNNQDIKESDEKDINRNIEKEKIQISKSLLKADIDLFLVTRDIEQALSTIITFYKRLRKNIPSSKEIGILRTKNAITFLLPWPYKSIQIICRLYHSIEQVLLGFDIDCCCVAYDGKKVITIPRGIRALKTKSNIVDVTRQSTSYEARLIKYAKRNFVISVPGTNIPYHIKKVNDAIDYSIQNRQYLSLNGFSLLLAMLYKCSSKDKNFRKYLDYSTNDYGYYTLNKVHRLLRRRKCNKFPFVYSDKILHALFDNFSNYNDTQIPSTLPQVISFHYNQPHRQDKVDNIFTGSFHPTYDKFYLD